ncbi:MAG: hypothetical protein ACE1ZQ_09405, partial [Ignavibacteriaceae bacterium]
MKTFNNSKELKSELIEKLKHHQDLDTFLQGQWLTDEKVEGNGFKGCFYGCTMQTSVDAILKFSNKYSVDLWFCMLTENIFEGLPVEESKTFPLECIQALPVGLDINKIKSEWNTIVLKDQLKFVEKGSEQEKAINQCIDLFKVPFMIGLVISPAAAATVIIVSLVAKRPPVSFTLAVKLITQP